MNKDLDTKTKYKRLELELDNGLAEAKNGYPDWKDFLADVNGNGFDPEEDYILIDDDIEVTLIPETSPLTKALDKRNGNGIPKYLSLQGADTERFQRLFETIKSRNKENFEKSDTTILDLEGNEIKTYAMGSDKKFYRNL